MLLGYSDSWRRYSTLFCSIFFSVQMWKVSHLLFSTSMSNKGREKFQENRMRLKESVGSWDGAGVRTFTRVPRVAVVRTGSIGVSQLPCRRVSSVSLHRKPAKVFCEIHGWGSRGLDLSASSPLLCPPGGLAALRVLLLPLSLTRSWGMPLAPTDPSSWDTAFFRFPKL